MTMRPFHINPTDKALLPAITDKIDNLNKPKGSLGRLESIATQLCLIQQTLSPTLSHPCHLLLGADHGIEREGVSVSPREVTWQQMVNFSRGGGGVNMFCRQHGFHLRIIDMGVDHDLSTIQGIIDRKIAWGTDNFLYGPAMTQEQMDKAIDTGALLAEQCHEEGCNILCIGEMGIANTSPSSIWMSLLGNLPLDECIGAGAGLASAGVAHKRTVLRKAVELYLKTNDAHDVEQLMRYFGGFEMVGAIGAMLRAAELGMTIMVDGFIMTACMLVAARLQPAITDYAIFGHCGNESGHRRMLQLLDVQPLLSLGLCLGEGTGALCAYPIIDSAVRMINEMNDFEHANITKYF